MTKENHTCDNVNCNHNNTKGLCCLHNPDNCKYRQLQKENAELKKENENLASIAEHQQSSNMKRYFEIEELKRKNTDLEEKLANADYQLEGRDNETAELKENNSFLNNLVKEKEQRGLEVQEDLLKEIAELEKKISVLLSCKSCPENKGGLICQKEYENKCLAQKIEFIKELQKENAELKATYKKQRNKRIDELQKENAELKKEEIEIMTNFCKACKKMHTDNLTKAKEILRLFLDANDNLEMINAQRKAEQFISEVEK